MPWKEMLTIVCFMWIDFNKQVFATAVQNSKDIPQSVSSVNNNLLSFYKNAPMAIYASAVPHGAYSFHAPVFRAPASSATNLVPVHSQNIVLHKQSGYLTDSDGNKFLETPQTISYKTVFPQEFVPLQDLPAHLSQPFVAAPSGFHVKQALPQYAYGAPLRLPQTLNTRGPAPLVYTQNASPLPLQYQPNFGNLPLQNFPFTASQQPSNQQAIFSSANSFKPFPTFNAEPVKFQRLEEKPIHVLESQNFQEQSPTTVRPTKAPTNKFTEQFKVTTVKDGKKTVVSIPTKPSLPILDYNLLEPLVFDNPVVPQVQHYLPKIEYPRIINTPVTQDKHKHSEFLTQITKYYGGPIKSINGGLEKSEGSYSHNDEDDEVEHRKLPNDLKNTDLKENNNLPQKKINEDREPSYIINDDEYKNHQYKEDYSKHKPENFEEKRLYQENQPKYYAKNNNHESHDMNQKQHEEHSNNNHQQNINQKQYLNEKSKPQIHHEKQYIKQERAPKPILSVTSNNSKVKIHSKFQPVQGFRQPNHPMKATFKIAGKPHSSFIPHYVDVKPKQITVKEEAPVHKHSLREQMIAEVIKEEDNNEEDFEKAYKNAAYGFPAFNQDIKIEEKDIYNPESYGVPRYHEAFEFENSPFEQFFHNGDEKPKSSRLTYKEIRNHNIDDYMKDFNEKYPKEMKEFLKSHKDYFQDYKGQPYYFSNIRNEKSRPEYILGHKKKNDNRKYFSHYKAKPHKYELDNSKVNKIGRDSYAHATKPSSSYRNKLWSNTQFVEPQFQYGFEPIPKLLDSELAAMASNDSPESDTPGSRKKIYKENWYIHKTSTGGKS